MAVTIHDTPDDYTPSDNPIVWTFSSDQTAQPNFAFIVDVYVNDTLAAEELVFLESGIYARFDATNFGSNNCNIPTLPSGINGDAQNYCDLRITVHEYYGDPPSKQANSAATNIKAFKSGLEDFDFIDWDATNYIASGANKNWLSAFPDESNRLVKRTGENLYLMCISDSAAFSLTIKTYEADGTLLGTYASPQTSYPINIIKIDPPQLVADVGISASEFTDAAYYTINTANFEVIRIDLDDKCVYDNAKRIHFISHLGSIEAFTFHLISREKAKIKSFGYERNFGEWDGSSFVFNKDRGTNIDYKKIVDHSMTIESDWITEDVQHWLVKNLYSSVRIWEEATDAISKAKIMVERKIITASYAKKYQLNDTLFNEVIEIGLPSHSTMNV